jgi:hypothetical protein
VTAVGEGVDDPTVRLILLKAGYGLARPKWLKCLEEIRALPEVGREAR